MSKMAIYNRPTGSPYTRIEERRGVKTATFQPPFYVRITIPDTTIQGGKKRRMQQWVKLDAQVFDQAKDERDRKERGETLAAESPANRTSIGAAVHEFIESKKRKSPATVRNYTHILNEFLDQTSAKFIDEINSKVLDAYITWLEKERGAEPKTIKNKTQVVVFMLKHAGVPKPSAMVKDLVPVVEEEPAEPYDKKELEKLFASMDQGNVQRYTFFLVTACREKEVAHARWDDIVMRDSIPHYWVRAKKFTKSDGQAGAFSPKNHENRYIPLTRELVDMLQSLKKNSKSEWIFPNSNGDPEGHFLYKFKSEAFDAGLNCGKCNTTRREGRYEKVEVQKNCATFSQGCEKHYLHRLRKTRATFWHDNGIPIRTIQYRLGHKSLETTQKYLGIKDSAETTKIDNKPMF